MSQSNHSLDPPIPVVAIEDDHMIGIKYSTQGAGTSSAETPLRPRDLCNADGTLSSIAQTPKGAPVTFQGPEMHRHHHRVRFGESNFVQRPLVLHNWHRVTSVPHDQSKLRQPTFVKPSAPRKDVGTAVPSGDSTIAQDPAAGDKLQAQAPEGPSTDSITYEDWDAALSLMLLHHHAAYADKNNIPREVLRNMYVNRFGNTHPDDFITRAAVRAAATTPSTFDNDDLLWLIWSVKQMGTVVNASHFCRLACEFSRRHPDKKVTAEQLYYKWAGYHEEMSRAGMF